MRKLLLPLLLLAGMGYAEEAVKSPTPFVEHHNRIVIFDTLHQAYERIKPNALYAGIEAWFTRALNRDYSGILEAEFRMGYNFFYNGRDHFTPVVGVGVFKDYHRYHEYTIEIEDRGFFESIVITHKRRTRPAIVYGMAGFLYDHEFNSVVNLGVNLKGMVGGASGNKHRHISWGSTIVGFDVSVPLTFRFGPKRHWDIRIEPFNIYMHGSKASRDYVGFRSTVGYRF